MKRAALLALLVVVAARRGLRRRRRRHRSAAAGQLRLCERRGSGRRSTSSATRSTQTSASSSTRRSSIPGRVSLKTFFEPYEPIEEMEVSRREAGRPGGGPLPASAALPRARVHHLDPGRRSPNPGGSAPRTFRFQPASGAVHGSGRRTAAAPPHGPVRADRVGHAHQRTGRDAGVSASRSAAASAPLPAISQRHVRDDPRRAAAPAGRGLARAARDPGSSAGGANADSRRRPSPSRSPRRWSAPIALVEWSLGRENGAERRAALDALADGARRGGAETAWPTRRASRPGRRPPPRPARRSESSRS